MKNLKDSLWFIFIINLCRLFFCNFRKKGPRPKWTIYKHVSDNSKKCLSVGNSGILFVVVCHLCLVAHRFTILSQHMYLVATHILIYWYARCDCKLWNALWFYCIFLVFSYIIDDHCLKYCLFTKLSQIVCQINTHILIC